MNNNLSNQSKPMIKLPPLGSLLQLSRDRMSEFNDSAKYCSTPSSSSFNAAYNSPSMSEHDISFKYGKFEQVPSSETTRSNNLFVKTLPLTPPNVSIDSFSKYQSEEGSQARSSTSFDSNISQADDTFYAKNVENQAMSSFTVAEKPLQGLGIQYQPVMKIMKKKSSKKIKESKKITNPKGTFAFITHSSTSYSSKEAPSIDNEQLARQKRRRTDAKIVTILEDCYKNVCCRPNKVEKIALSQQTGLTFGQVQVWFQNRRSRDTKQLKKNDTISEQI